MTKIGKILVFFITLIVVACSYNYDILPSEEPVIISTDNTTRLISNPITFKATKSGIDITSEVEFYVNDIELSNNVFISDVTGSFEVLAKHNGYFSEPITITYHDGSQTNFKKRVLVEDYTGTWCGYCTRVSYAIEQLLLATDAAIPVAIHRSSSVPTSGTYDPYNFDSSALENILSTSGYPKAYLNRMTVWNSPQPSYINQAVDLTNGDNPKLGLSLNSSVINNTIDLTVNVKISQNFSNLKMVVYVLENGLYYSQKNYSSYYNAVNPIPNFEHNHVLRHCVTDLFGDTINNNEFVNDVYSRNFSFTIPSNISDINNIEFVAFVVNENGDTINVRASHKDENQDFEEI
ncbi:MAG: Omp28-related outer membrane protein [Flavobacterium haoranii]